MTEQTYHDKASLLLLVVGFASVDLNQNDLELHYGAVRTYNLNQKMVEINKDQSHLRGKYLVEKNITEFFLRISSMDWSFAFYLVLKCLEEFNIYKLIKNLRTKIILKADKSFTTSTNF